MADSSRQPSRQAWSSSSCAKAARSSASSLIRTHRGAALRPLRLTAARSATSPAARVRSSSCPAQRGRGTAARQRGGGRGARMTRAALRTSLPGQHAAADLVELDGFEQGLEVALSEALVALALDDLEEDRADHVLGEDLQQQALALGGRAVQEDAVGPQALQALAMARHAGRQLLVVGVGRLLELDASLAHGLNGSEDVA